MLKIAHRDSDFEFSFARVRGQGFEATADLRIPRAVWSIKHAEGIEAAFQAQGFEYSKDESVAGYIYVVTIDVRNIWDADSGATGAHAANTLIQAVGLDEKARFDARYIGKSSKRILNAKNHL